MRLSPRRVRSGLLGCCLAVALLGATGCAPDYMPPLSPAEPAHPEAPATPPTAPPALLDAAPSVPLQAMPAPAMPAPAMPAPAMPAAHRHAAPSTLPPEHDHAHH